MKWAKSICLTGLVLAILVLHQDFWNWSSTQVIGFLPIGLFYHAMYSIACSVLMAVLVFFAWPKHLEELEKFPTQRDQSGGGH